jgi:hypothetical protein
MRIALEQWMLGSSRMVVPGDVARIVQERMNPERRKLVEAVLSSSRALPEALAYQLLAMQDKTDTPTATSGLVVQPSNLKKKKKPRESIPDPEATLVVSPQAEDSISVTMQHVQDLSSSPPPGRSSPPNLASTPTSRPPRPSAAEVVARDSTRPTQSGALATVVTRLSSIPPKFRSGTMNVWVFWIVALAVAIVALAYSMSQP